MGGHPGAAKSRLGVRSRQGYFATTCARRRNSNCCESEHRAGPEGNLEVIHPHHCANEETEAQLRASGRPASGLALFPCPMSLPLVPGHRWPFLLSASR